MKYIVAESGLQQSALGIRMSPIVASALPPASIRQSVPCGLWPGSFIVPTQNRPARSTLPSFIRFSLKRPSPSGSQILSIPPVSRSK